MEEITDRRRVKIKQYPGGGWAAGVWERETLLYMVAKEATLDGCGASLNAWMRERALWLPVWYATWDGREFETPEELLDALEDTPAGV